MREGKTMSEKTKPENPPAFPALHSIDGNWEKEPNEKFRGMTLRDYFAGKAIAGVMANPWPADNEWPEIARRAYVGADAMLAERERTQ
jgi:hypothetical protein